MRDGQTKNDKQVKIELLSQWMLEAEFRKLTHGGRDHFQCPVTLQWAE